jgi:hypothetical protein
MFEKRKTGPGRKVPGLLDVNRRFGYSRPVLGRELQKTTVFGPEFGKYYSSNHHFLTRGRVGRRKKHGLN